MTSTMQRITELCQDGARRARTPDPARLADLKAEKTRELDRGTLILTTGSLAERDKWLNNYKSLCHTINQLEAAA